MHDTPVAAATLASILALASLAGGCGSSTPAEAVRPKDPTAAGALGEGDCHDVTQGGEPLVVDWKAEDRGDLEVAMKDGVAVVAYSCKSLKLLKDCHLDGKYGYIGMTKKEQVVRLKNADEVQANLPLSGATIGGQLNRGSTLDIAMILVGKRRTTWTDPTKQDLKGGCDGATHYVRGATVGAFALDTGAEAKARAAAEIFTASASGSSESSKSVHAKEGEPGDCAKSSPDADKPPPQCGAPVRIVLGPFAAAPAADKPAKPPEKPEDRAVKVEAPESTCPAGLVLAEGKCTKPADAAAYQCRATDAGECAAQCDKGHAGSCGAWGALLATGSGGASRDPGKAATAFKKGCDGGDARSCSNLGISEARGLAGAANPGAATPHFEAGCKGGDALGCRWLGEAYRTGKGAPQDDGRALAALRQACDGGDDLGCGGAGALLLAGKGGAADPKKAAEYFDRACAGADAQSCSAIGELYESNTLGKNLIIAQMKYQRGCIRMNPDSCADLGRLELAKDPNGAKRHLEQACRGFPKSAVACATLKVMFGGSDPVFPDIAKQNAANTACTSGSMRDCTTAGILAAATGNAPLAKANLQRACTTGDAVACAVQKKVP